MSPVYKVYRRGEKRLRVTSAELLEDGEHILSHNGAIVPIKIEDDTFTVHVCKSEGNLGDGLVGFADEIFLGELKRSGVTEVSVHLSPEDHGSGLTLFGDYETDDPDLYIERHERRSKNFPFSPGKERK